MALTQCSECQGKMSTEAKFCPHCGHVPKATIECPECKDKMNADAKFCPHCGYTPNHNSPQTKPKIQKSSSKKWLFISLGLFLISGLTTFLVWHFVYNQEESQNDYQSNNSYSSNNDTYSDGTSTADNKTFGNKNNHTHTQSKPQEDPNIKYTRDNIYTLLVPTATYNTVLLGGITNCYVKLSNNSNYPIEQAEIYVAYIRDNGQLYKQEPVYFYNIPANTALTLQAPNSDRGVKVNVYLNRVKSKKLGLDGDIYDGEGD